MDTLVHLIYASTATCQFGKVELLTLLKQARENNAKLGVTGMLLHQDGNFFQVLEGPPVAVGRLFAKIGTDKRHCKTTKIIEESIIARSFEDWTMAFSEITRAELVTINGLNDFFGRGATFAQMSGGRAKKLASAFGEGQWRNN